MPYKIPGVAGTWYEPGTRKGNCTIAWRGRLPDGTWTEFFTDSTTDAGAQAFLRRTLEKWQRDRPTAAGEPVDLATAAHHYKLDRARSDEERDRVDRIVALVGGTTPVAAINQTHLTAAAATFRAQRLAARDQAIAERQRIAREQPDRRPPQVFPLPSTPTLNRELTTPLRAVLNFAAEQPWRGKIVLRALKPLEGEIPPPPQRAASDADVDQLLAAIDEQLATLQPTGRRQLNYRRRRTSLTALRALLIVVHERGYRISEWLRWSWQTVELPAGRATILLSKPARWVELDLSPDAVAALAAIDPKRGRVFPWGHRNAVYNAVDRIAEPLGVTWRPHQSRRAVVTAIIRNTGDPTVARDYVGHASVKTTLRYRVVDPGDVRPGVRRVSKK